MKRKGVHNVPDFSRKTAPKSKAAPAGADPKPVTPRTVAAAPKPHSTSSKSGRRGS